MKVVTSNERYPREILFNFGRFENVKLLNLIIILDKDKLVVVYWNDWYPVLNDCRLGRFEIVK